MNIVETYKLAPTKAARLFWTPGYVGLSQAAYVTYTNLGETVERARHVRNMGDKWGISRRCAEAILTGEAVYILSDDTVIITRPVIEE